MGQTSTHPYLDWPYATDYVQKTLDPLAIDRHARLILARALNVGRVIAFVGAGSSMSYGRISWKELVEAEADFVESKADEFLKALQPDQRQYNIGVGSRIELLTQRLRSLKAPENIQPDKYLMIYQVAEELDRALSQATTGQTENDRRLRGATASPETSRDRTAALVSDDRGHAIRILKSATKNVRNDKRDKVFQQIESNEHPFSYRKYFTLSSLEFLINKTRETNSDQEFIRELLAGIMNFSGIEHSEFGGHKFLFASQRHRIGAMLALLTNLDEGSSSSEADLDAWWSLSTSNEPTGRYSVKRELLVPRMRDPLGLLVDNLKIRRFITTNYDQEIERIHRDMGFRMVSSSAFDKSGLDNATPSLLHPTFTELVFGPQEANALTAFAARERNPAGVIHLHGRVSSAHENAGAKPKFENSVITERDYQQLYLNQKGDTETDDALNIAFGGNPLLFVGSGMGEDDILRPMREFMSGSIKFGDRAAIALLPGLDNDNKRDAQRVNLLNRYGVYTIYFGDVSYENTEANEDRSTRPLWLNLLNELHDKLKAVFDSVEKCHSHARKPISEVRVKISELKKWIKDTQKSEFFFFESCSGSVKIRMPKLVEGIDIDLTSNVSLKSEIDLINCALTYALKDPNDWKTNGREKAARALNVLISGAKDSAVTACLCAALVRLRNDWTDWKTNWYELPPALWFNYKPALQESDHGVNGKLSVVRRHVPALGLDADENISHSRFFSGVVSQTLLALLQSLKPPHNSSVSTDPGVIFTNQSGRRILLLLGRHGVGKGHLFMSIAGAASTKNLNLDKLLSALGNNKQNWLAAGFYNFDLSREVMSVFDNIAGMLDDINGQKTFLPGNIQRNRLEWLKRGLNRFKLKSLETTKDGHTHGRILLVFNGVDALFDNHGNPKNGEIGQVINTLLDPDFSQAPIDFVFIFSEDNIPINFRGKSYLALIGRESSSTDNHSPHLAAEHRKRLRDSMGDDVFVASNGSPCPEVAAFIMRPAQAGTFASVYFPAVCLAHALKLWESCTSSKAASIPYIMNSDFIKSIFKIINDDISDDINIARTIFPLAIVLTAGKFIIYKHKQDTQLLDFFTKSCEYMKSNWDLFGDIDSVGVLLEKLIGKNYICDIGLDPKCVRTVAASYDRTMRELYLASGRNRFALTLILSRLEVGGRLHDSISKILRGPTANQALDLEKLRRRAVDNVNSSLNEILLQIKGLPSSHVTDAILENLLPALERRKSWHVRTPDDGRPSFVVNEPCLTTELVWHLAIIGQPVELKVLAVCPRLRSAAIYALNSNSMAASLKDEDIEKVLADSIKLAVEQCLVFEVYNAPPQGAYAASPRYSVHRSTQKFVFQKLGAPHVDVIHAEHFAPSLYADQTEDLPKLKPEAHRQVMECFDALCGYPNGGNEVGRFNDLFYDQSSTSNEPIVVASQRLRAAYGIIRAIYSVAVLARFDSNFDEQSSKDFHEGHFEALRRRIRWILRQSQRFSSESFIDPNSKLRLSFYDEEIVWLYNECGLLSFVQGQLNDADALFGMALAAAKRIEPDETGVLHQRVILNHAQVAIERGRSAEAEAAISRILERRPMGFGKSLKILVPSQYQPEDVVRLIARGYFGLIKNLAGEFSTAEKCYIESINGLLDLGALRGASIFCRHYSALLSNQKRSEQADRFEADAIHLAQKGGHEDIRQMAELARIRRRIMRLLLEKGSSGDATIHRELDVIENYAHMVGMPRLVCEVYQGRAQLLQVQGELELAGRFAARSLEIASMNSLRLRKILSLILLASINKDRGKNFLPVLNLGIDLAKRSGQSLHLEKAYRLLGSVVHRG